MSSQQFVPWALLAVGDHRQHGGNDGYDDNVDRYYSWDSTVPNHRALAVGDVAVLWDKTTLLGASVIDDITPGSAKKTRRSCPHCGKASLKARKTKLPIWKCFKCGETFDVPRSEQAVVQTYRADYASSWVGLEGTLSGAEVRRICRDPRSQLSLRQVDWPAFLRAVERSGGADRLTDLLTRLELAASS